CRDSFRLRNKRNKSGTLVIRIGEQHPRSVTLPKLGTISVHDDTRRLRRLLHPVEQVDPDMACGTSRRWPGFCSSPAAVTAPVGTSASMSGPPTFIQSAATNLASTMTRAGSSAWTAALPRSP
ncbi:MAG: hypothetical protein ABW234_00965, partial [Actinomycetes bacterium]